MIVNEFGEIGIDNELIVDSDEEVFEMNNGCICCTVRGDLIRIIGNLIKRKGRLDGIIVETTGLADPTPVAQTFFVDDDVARRTRLDAVVTVVDARHVMARLHDSRQAVDQIAFADVIVLNKTDLVDATELATLEHTLHSMNRFAPIYPAQRSNIVLDKVLDRGAFDLSRILDVDPHFLCRHSHQEGHAHDDHCGHHHGETHSHYEGISSVSLQSDTPLDTERFDAWIGDVLAHHGQNILRAKGILNLAEHPDRFVFQAVHMVKEGSFQRPWKANENKSSRLVFIGRDLPVDELRKGFASCSKHP